MEHFLSIRLGRQSLLSLLVPRRAIMAAVTLLLATLTVAVFSTGLGEIRISAIDVVKVLVGSGSEEDSLIIQTFRLPRVITGLLVGAALGAAGALMQGVVRNPLASPDILGVTGGASVAAVAFLTMLESASIQWLPLVAFLGAAMVSVVLYGLAWKQGVTPLRLVLIGIGVKGATAALTTMLIVMAPIHLTSKAMIWLTGTLYGTTWTDVGLLLPWVAVLLVLGFVTARQMNALQLGDHVAAGIGSSVQQQQLLLMLICVGLTGSAVAIGGAIGFVALLAPHIARQLVGPSFESLLPISAMVGAFIVTGADMIARIAFSPLDIPVGAVTSAVGAPFFLYLLYKNRS
ncbi:MAG: FecCD family ABC transporter permease [Clostridia bacterium]